MHRPAPPPVSLFATPPASPSSTAPSKLRPEGSDRRNVLLVALVLVAVAGTFGLIALVATLVSGGSGTDSITQPRATDGLALPEPSGSAETNAPGSVPPGGEPLDGLTVTASVVSPTMIDVLETVRWPDGGPATIELELPPDLAAASRLTVAATPTVESLQVSVDGSPATPVQRDGGTNAWLVIPPSGAAPRAMEIRYRLEGAIVRSEPAVPGRALALLTPISYGAAVDLSITIDIAASGVLNVYCPTAPNLAALSCGRLEGNRWTVTPPPGRPLVLAQLTLPLPT